MPILQDAGGSSPAPPPPSEPAPAPPPSEPAPPPPASTTIAAPGVAYIDSTSTPAPPVYSAPPPPIAPSSPDIPPPTEGTPAAPTILEPGSAYIDLGDVLGPLDLIKAPPRSDGTPADIPLPPEDAGLDGDPLKGWTLDDPFASRSLAGSNPPLKGFEWVSAMVDLASQWRLDAKAIAADVLGEGHAGTIGDGGWAYGPFQDHLTEFFGRPFYGKGKNNVTVNRWAWTRNGLEYSMRQIAFGEAAARGLTGHDAIAAIVRHYEKPVDIPGQIRVRSQIFDQLESMGGSWVAYFAGRVLGPAGGGGVDNTTVVGAPTPVDKVPKPSKQWKATLHFLANDVPAAGHDARKAGQRVHDAVRSPLWRTPTG